MKLKELFFKLTNKVGNFCTNSSHKTSCEKTKAAAADHKDSVDSASRSSCKTSCEKTKTPKSDSSSGRSTKKEENGPAQALTPTKTVKPSPKKAVSPRKKP